MNNDMNKNWGLWLILAVLVVMALFAAFWAATHIPLPFLRILREARRYLPVRGDIEFYYTVKTVISTINATLLIFLLITYIDIYTKTKSDFTIGLIMFSMVLLLYALSSNPLLQWIFGFRAFGLGPFAMLPDLFTFVALVVLLYLTVKY